MYYRLFVQLKAHGDFPGARVLDEKCFPEVSACLEDNLIEFERFHTDFKPHELPDLFERKHPDLANCILKTKKPVFPYNPKFKEKRIILVSEGSGLRLHLPPLHKKPIYRNPDLVQAYEMVAAFMLYVMEADFCENGFTKERHLSIPQLYG